jgi:hypothetical protein
MRALGVEGFAEDADTWARSGAGDERIASADAACVAFITAQAAAAVGGTEASEREREWQAGWLSKRLGLA